MTGAQNPHSASLTRPASPRLDPMAPPTAVGFFFWGTMLPLASLMVPLLQGHLGVSNDPLFLWQSLRLLAHGKHSAEIVVSCFIACLRLSAFRIASLRKRPASLGVAMEAKRLLEGAPFNPELAQACGEAVGVPGSGVGRR
jgi:hypothetical protein